MDIIRSFLVDLKMRTTDRILELRQMNGDPKVEPRIIMMEDGGEVTVREANENDAREILEYLHRNADRFPFMINTADELEKNPTTEIRFIQAHHRSENCIMIVATHRMRIIGLLNCLGGQKRRTKHDAEFGLSVDADYFRKGVGSAMMDTLMHWAKNQSPLERLTLMVMHDNCGAIALYKRYGFIQEGIRHSAVKIDDAHYQNLIIMARWLRRKEG